MRRLLSLVLLGVLAVAAVPASAHGISANVSANSDTSASISPFGLRVKAHANVRAHANADTSVMPCDESHPEHCELRQKIRARGHTLRQWARRNLTEATVEAKKTLRMEMQELMQEAREQYKECKEIDDPEEKRSCALEVRTELRTKVKAAIEAAREESENEDDEA